MLKLPADYVDEDENGRTRVSLKGSPIELLGDVPDAEGDVPFAVPSTGASGWIRLDAVTEEK